MKFYIISMDAKQIKYHHKQYETTCINTTIYITNTKHIFLTFKKTKTYVVHKKHGV